MLFVLFVQDLQKRHLQPKEDVYEKSKAKPLKTFTKDHEKSTKQEKSKKINNRKPEDQEKFDATIK